MSTPLKIVIAAFDGALPSGLFGLQDLFYLANIALTQSGQAGAAEFQPLIASAGRQAVKVGNGRMIETDAALEDMDRCDAVIIPGFAPNALGVPPRPQGLLDSIGWLRAQHARSTWVSGACAGVFALGEAGLLDGRRCTTTWWMHDELKRRFPKADAAWGASLLEDRRVVTTGGPLSWIDSGLHVIRVLAGPAAARIAADFAVVDTTPLTQAVYVPSGHIASTDPFLINAEQAVRQARDESLSTTLLAERLNTSERTLHRRLKALTGESPKNFIARLRLETARMLLETGPSSIKQIALSSGYLDEGSFRRAFRRFAGMTPTGYREWSRQRRLAS